MLFFSTVTVSGLTINYGFPSSYWGDLLNCQYMIYYTTTRLDRWG